MDNRERTTSRVIAGILISIFSALVLVACAGMGGNMPGAAGAGQITPTPALVYIRAMDANGGELRGTVKEWYWDGQSIPATVGPDDSRIVYSEYVSGPITFQAARAPQQMLIRLVQLEGSTPPVQSMIEPGSESMVWDPGALAAGKYLIMVSAKFAEGNIEFMYGLNVAASATAEPTEEATTEP
jgi:hypothetical protein